jgi:UDP-glucose 4-epimerase
MEQLKGKKILITGGSGFIGTYLANECYKYEGELYGIDIRDPFDASIWTNYCTKGISDEEVDQLFVENQFDFVFHLAGGASVADSVTNPTFDFNSLVPTTFQLIQKIKANCPNAHLVLFSSAAVYGNPESFPIKEDAQLKPMSPYGIHKKIVEQLVAEYSTYYTIKCSVLRIFSAYGNGLRKQLFWDVMGRYKKSKEENAFPVLELFGTGLETRDFIHVEDLASAAVIIATREKESKQCVFYNVASGKETQISEAMQCLFSDTDVEKNITFNGVTRAGDPVRWKADISKLTALGFVPKKELQSGLKGYYEWFSNI